MGVSWWLPPPAAIRTAVTTTARAASTSALTGSRGRCVGIEAKIAGIRDGLDEAGGRGDHGRVVGAERKRRKRGVGQRRAQLGVGGHPADDRDCARSYLPGGLLGALDERAHDRALVARSEIGPPPVELVRVE